MKIVIYVLLLLIPSPLIFASNEIIFSEAQIEALSIKTESLTLAESFGGALFLGKITIPPKQDQIVSTPLNGLIESILVAQKA